MWQKGIETGDAAALLELLTQSPARVNELICWEKRRVFQDAAG
jgi:hypothetical protein